MSTVIVAGYLRPLLKVAADSEPTGSFVVVDEPDVIAQRDIATVIADLPVVRELVSWEYQLPSAADRFYLEHRDLDVIAVVPAVEYAVPFAARLAERYGVPGATLGAAELLRDKHLLRRVTAAAGIANPESELVAGPGEVLDFARRHPGPVVVKPANRQAAVGTFIVTDPDDIERGWAQAMEQDEGVYVPRRSIALRMLAERFVDGPEFSVEMLVQDGQSLFANVTGKELIPGPRPVELGHIVPADLPEPAATALIEATARVADAVGFRTGFLHCEWILAGDVPHLVECAGRMPGDHIMELIRHAWPLDIVRRYLVALRGEPPEPVTSLPQYSGAVWFLHADTGIVEGIDGLDEARAAPGIAVVSCDVGIGDHTHAIRSSWDRVGVVMAFGNDAAEAVRKARGTAEMIKFRVRPPD